MTKKELIQPEKLPDLPAEPKEKSEWTSQIDGLQHITKVHTLNFKDRISSDSVMQYMSPQDQEFCISMQNNALIARSLIIKLGNQYTVNRDIYQNPPDDKETKALLEELNKIAYRSEEFLTLNPRWLEIYSRNKPDNPLLQILGQWYRNHDGMSETEEPGFLKKMWNKITRKADDGESNSQYKTIIG